MQRHIYFMICFLSSFLSSCAPYKVPTKTVVLEKTCAHNTLCQSAAEHWLYKIVPRHRSQIYWFDIPHWTAWALLGNDDDGIFGEAITANYKVQETASLSKAARWYIRNPLHNFSFYVIGTAYMENSTITLLKLSPEEICLLKAKPTEKTVFAGHNHGLYLALHGYKPFISLQLNYGKRFRTYIGWRERGNFGLKLQPMSD